MSDVDRAARRYFRTMMRLGMFDPMDRQPMVTEIGPEQVDSPASRALAKRTAVQSIVLLKNDGGALPLDGVGGRLAASKVKFAFLGPHANSTQDLLSAPQYHGANQLVDSHSPLMVAQARGWDVTYAKGVNICDSRPPGYPNQPCGITALRQHKQPPAPDTSGIAAAVVAAKAADVAVLFLGSDQTTEAENFDRVSLGLVGAQEQLLREVTAVNKHVILVLIHGGPIDVSSAVQNPSVRAILDAFQPGELGADAILDLLTGVESPSALMPYTTYFQNFTRRDIREVDMRAGTGTTYWWMTDPVLFKFGYGMSFTTWDFRWENGTPPQQQALPVYAGSFGGVNHSVVVSNTGNRTSDVVALAFVVRSALGGSPAEMPLRKLFGFERFSSVQPGESRTAFFASTAESLGVVGLDGAKRLHPGRYRVEVGSVQAPAVHELELVGERSLLVEQNAWAQRLSHSASASP